MTGGSSAGQVFLYVTGACNARCLTCYSTPWMGGLEVASDSGFSRVLTWARAQGTRRLTLLGGEPTLVESTPRIAVQARSLGFHFIRLVTNGMYETGLLDSDGYRDLDVVCFSLDGHTSAINDYQRVGTDHRQVVRNIEEALRHGFDVRISHTVTSHNLDYVPDMIEFANNLGVTQINLNIAFSIVSAAKDPSLSVDPHRWCDVYQTVVETAHSYELEIKVPIGYATREELAFHRGKGHECLAKDGTRLYVQPNLDTYTCPLLLGRSAWKSFYLDDENVLSSHPDFRSIAGIDQYCRFLPFMGSPYFPLCIFYKDRLNRRLEGIG